MFSLTSHIVFMNDAKKMPAHEAPGPAAMKHALLTVLFYVFLATGFLGANLAFKLTFSFVSMATSSCSRAS